MSNLNTHGVNSYESAQHFLAGKSHRQLCFATTLTHEAVGNGVTAVTVRHHGSPIIRYSDNGRVEIRNAGWLSSTTTHRLHHMTPATVRVSRAKGGSVESPAYSGPQPHDFTEVIPARERDSARIAQAEAYVTSRFFPPLPVTYGALAVEAVDACNAGDPFAEVDVTGLDPQPRGSNFGEGGRTFVNAGELVDALRLHHLVDWDDEA